MKRRHMQSSSVNAAGLAIGSILALIVAMAISVVFDVQPAEARSALSSFDSRFSSTADCGKRKSRCRVAEEDGQVTSQSAVTAQKCLHSSELTNPGNAAT